jgi:hypothetical protein
MSYERDRDRATRGPGAIAALDRPGGRRDLRRLARAQATIARDRAMSAVTWGALGRIDLGSQTGAQTTRPRSGGSGITISKISPVPPPPAPIMPVMTRFPDPVPPSGGIPLPTMKPPTTGETPPIIAPVPILTILDPPPRPSGGGPGGGMSSGGGTVMTTGGQPPPIQVRVGPDAPVPDVTDASDHTTRNLLLVGGGALALFLLLRKRGG